MPIFDLLCSRSSRNVCRVRVNAADANDARKRAQNGEIPDESFQWEAAGFLDDFEVEAVEPIAKPKPVHEVTLTAVAVTAAALGASLCSDERFQAWFYGPSDGGTIYGTQQDSYGGYVGLYGVLATRAEQIEQAVARNGQWGEDFDFYMTVDTVVDAMLKDHPPIRPEEYDALLVRI